MIVGLAGHIDHGKTSLVKALTGVAGDRLKDEKARGITIDLGFAYMPTRSGQPIGFIDVPGHERFVHTMLAGASGVDFALLTIAVDDGIMPQTLEHLAILDLLGINRGAVVITKVDLASPESIENVARQAKAMIAATTLAHAKVLPVSALTGAGVVDLIITDLGVFEVPEKGRDGDLRLLEMAPDVTVDELRAKTEAPFRLTNS